MRRTQRRDTRLGALRIRRIGSLARLELRAPVVGTAVCGTVLLAGAARHQPHQFLPPLVRATRLALRTHTARRRERRDLSFTTTLPPLLVRVPSPNRPSHSARAEGGRGRGGGWGTSTFSRNSAGTPGPSNAYRLPRRPSRPFFSLRSAEEDEPPFVGPWARAGDVVRPSTGDGRRCGEVSRDDTGEEVSDPGFELDRDMFGDV